VVVVDFDDDEDVHAVHNDRNTEGSFVVAAVVDVVVIVNAALSLVAVAVFVVVVDDVEISADCTTLLFTKANSDSTNKTRYKLFIAASKMMSSIQLYSARGALLVLAVLIDILLKCLKIRRGAFTGTTASKQQSIINVVDGRRSTQLRYICAGSNTCSTGNLQ
jgi:hypothetical protein